MSQDDNIKKLTEMGFSQEQAVKALQVTKNDVESAIAYLFEDPIEIDTPSNNELVTYNDSVKVLNPGDVPDFTQIENTQQSYPEYPQNVQYLGLEMSDGQEEDVDFEHYEYHEKPELGCIYDDISNMQRDGDVNAVLSKRSGFLENYYIPVLTILSQLGQFKSIFLKPLDQDFQYDSNWAIGKPQSISIPSGLEDGKDSSFKFFVELQKIMGFLDGRSVRSFVSGDNLVVNLPNDIKKRLVYNKIETVDELLPKLYESLQANHDKLFDHSELLDKLFKSSVESVNEELINNIYTFDVDVEYRHATLYESFNELFWGNDLDMFGNVRLINTAKVLTIQLVGDEDSYAETKFQLDETFYPELYSSDYFPLISEMNNKRIDITKQRAKISNEIMQLNSFEGKKVKGFLDTSILYLKSQNSDIEDLANLSEQIANQKLKLTGSLEPLNTLYSKLDIRNHENILQQIRNLDVRFPTKYILLGVILSDTEFYYKCSATGDWVYQKAVYSSNNVVIDYEVDKLDFVTIQQDILQYSSSGVKPMLLIYASSDTTDVDGDIQNDKLHDFFSQDNAKFKDQLAMHQSQSNDNNSAMDEGDDVGELSVDSPKHDDQISESNKDSLIDL